MRQVMTLAEAMDASKLPVDLLPVDHRAVPVYTNARLRSVIGRARWIGRGPFRTARVELQPWVLSSELAPEIVAHEAAHIVLGPGYGHCYVWRAWCRKLGGTGETKIAYDRVAGLVPESTVKTVAVCEVCGFQLKARRALRRGTIYTHRVCGGRFRC